MIGRMRNRTRIGIAVLALLAIPVGLNSAPVASVAQDADTKCGKCGAANKAGQKFCGDCGAKLEAPKPRATRCEACGAQGQPGQKFCGECGGKLVSGEPPRAGGQTFLHPDHAVTVTLPDGWTMRKEQFQFGIAGTILEFHKGNEIFGALAQDAQGRDPAALIRAIVESTKQAADKIEEIGQDTLPGGGVRLEFRATKGSYAQRYVTAAAAIDRKAYYLVLTAPEAQWSANGAAAGEIVRSLGSRAKTAEVPPRRDDPPIFQGQNFHHAQHGVSITVPEGWTLRKDQFQFGLQGTLLEFQTGLDVCGALGLDAAGTEPKALVEGVIKLLQQTAEKVEVVGQSQVGTGMLAQIRTSKGEQTWRWAVLALSQERKSFWVAVATPELLWNKYEASIDQVFRSLRFGEKKTEGSAETGFTHPDHRISMTLPQGWTQRRSQFQFGIQNTLLEFQCGTEVNGALVFDPSGTEPGALLQTIAKGFEQGGAKAQPIGEAPLAAGTRADLRVTNQGRTLRYTLAAVRENQKSYYVVLLMADELWARHQAQTDAIVGSLGFGTKPVDRPRDADPGTGGRTYSSAEHRFQLKMPEGWKFRDGQFRFGIEGSLLEIESDQGLKGILTVNATDQPVKSCLQRAVQSIEAKSDKLETLREVDFRYGGLRTDFKASKGQTTLRYALVVVPKNPGHYILLLMAADSVWEKIFLSADQLLQSWTFEKPPGGEPSTKKDPGTRRTNPWKGFKAGSWARYEVTSVSGNKQKKMEVSYVLVDPGDDAYFVMRTDLVLEGQEFPGKDTRVDLNQAEPGTVVKESDEKVRVPKGEFACRCVERSDGAARIRIWECADVPFAIVKRVDESGETTNTSVLVDFHKAP